jgi:HK97 gp10 family phage protein
MSVTMTVSGLNELEEALLELGNAVAGKVLYVALMTAAIPIQDTAIALAPQSSKPHYLYKMGKVQKVAKTGNKTIDRFNRAQALSAAKGARQKDLIQPGNLKRNIIRRRLKGRKYAGLTNGEAYVGVSWTGNAGYGRFIEFGTSKSPARPFLRPAFDARSAEALGIFTDKLRDMIEKARRRAEAQSRGNAR